MTTARRARVGMIVLGIGLAGQLGLDAATRADRPPLRRPLSSLPMRLGDWVGRDEPVDPDVRDRSQADELVNRVYEDPKRPGRRLVLWINYSREGLNLRHSPEVCLPGNGWSKVESQCRTLDVPGPGATDQPITVLGYEREQLAQGIGFWYYIFGEGRWERYVRRLPITSRSSHGRTTRGSGLTVEVFAPGESDPEGTLIRDLAAALLPELEPILPAERVAYFIP